MRAGQRKGAHLRRMSDVVSMEYVPNLRTNENSVDGENMKRSPSSNDFVRAAGLRVLLLHRVARWACLQPRTRKRLLTNKRLMWPLHPARTMCSIVRSRLRWKPNWGRRRHRKRPERMARLPGAVKRAPRDGYTADGYIQCCRDPVMIGLNFDAAQTYRRRTDTTRRFSCVITGQASTPCANERLRSASRKIGIRVPGLVDHESQFRVCKSDRKPHRSCPLPGCAVYTRPDHRRSMSLSPPLGTLHSGRDNKPRPCILDKSTHGIAGSAVINDALPKFRRLRLGDDLARAGAGADKNGIISERKVIASPTSEPFFEKNNGGFSSKNPGEITKMICSEADFLAQLQGNRIHQLKTRVSRYEVDGQGRDGLARMTVSRF